MASASSDWPRVVDVGLRDPQRPRLGQWCKWLTPQNRLVLTTTVWTRPIEEWFDSARNYVMTVFASDWEKA